MQFEHLVEVNVPDNPDIPDLTREEVWFGLLCRAEDPRPFLPGLVRCDIRSRSEDGLERTLVFGQAEVDDAVHWQAMEWMRFESKATADHAGGRLTISVEQPDPAGPALFLRFAYATTLSEAGADDAKYADIVRSAYHQSDVDTVRVIRMIAESTRTE